MEKSTRFKNSVAVLFNQKDLVITTIISLAYLVIARLLVGFKVDQLALVALFNIMYYASLPTRRLITGFSIFIVYWIIFDFMKAIPNYQYNTVHIASLYNAEKSLFAISANGRLITPNEFFVLYHTKFLDVLTGIFYLCWVPVPMLFAAWLFFKNRKEFIYFSLTFFLVNLLGFVVYYIYPAAPPWYVQLRGFHFVPGTPGNTAGLSRFDSITGSGIFQSLYAKSSNVFAAMPSLHSAYPLIVLYYGLKNRVGAANILFATVMIGIWFSAVYNSHHYVLDVLAGMICAVLAILLFNQVLLNDRRFNRFVSLFLLKMRVGEKVYAPL